jgi:hypothetical protein
MNGYNLLKTMQLNVACGSFILANTEGLHPTSHWSSFRSSHHGSPWISMDLHGFLATHVPLHHDEMLQWRKEAAEVGPMDRILAPKESSVRRDVFRFLWWTHLDFTKKNCVWIRSGQHNLVGDWATPLKHIRQLESLSHILCKIKNVWNHQPAILILLGFFMHTIVVFHVISSTKLGLKPTIWWRHIGDKVWIYSKPRSLATLLWFTAYARGYDSTIVTWCYKATKNSLLRAAPHTRNPLDLRLWWARYHLPISWRKYIIRQSSKIGLMVASPLGS